MALGFPVIPINVHYIIRYFAIVSVRSAGGFLSLWIVCDSLVWHDSIFTVFHGLLKQFSFSPTRLYLIIQELMHADTMSSVSDEFGKLYLDHFVRPACGPQVSINDFVDGYENPMAWHKKFVVRSDEKKKDVLFDNIDMRDITLAQYGSEQPENIKWRL